MVSLSKSLKGCGGLGIESDSDSSGSASKKKESSSQARTHCSSSEQGHEQGHDL